MQISNKHMHNQYDRIDRINSIEEIEEEIEYLEKQIQEDIFPDDMAGDIFMTSLLIYAKERKQIIVKESSCSIIYRCGWCGYPTDKDGKLLKEDPDEYLERYKLSKVENTNGECCPHGDGRPH